MSAVNRAGSTDGGSAWPGRAKGAVLSERPQPLYNYFKQLFAQVTNPPIDPIREELVMSLIHYIGANGSLLEETSINCRQLRLESPLLSNIELEKLRSLFTAVGDFKAHGESIGMRNP